MMLTIDALDLLALHDRERVLHQEERRAHVDGEHRVEKLGARVPDRAAIGDAGGVHQNVDAPERLVGLGDDLACILHRREIGCHEDRLDALLFERRFHLGAALGVAAGDDEAGDAALGEEMRDRLAKPLRRARDDGDLALERGVLQRRRIKHGFLPNCKISTRTRPQPIFTGLPVSRDFVAASAISCAFSPSVPSGFGFLPLTIVSMNASISALYALA